MGVPLLNFRLSFRWFFIAMCGVRFRAYGARYDGPVEMVDLSTGPRRLVYVFRSCFFLDILSDF